ncbi:MAG: TerB family tellurite resistance protein [Pseudomonadota bacterium]
MFSDLIRRLTEPAPQPLSEEDARAALAALLVRVARTDGYYAPDEVDLIDRILAARYGLTPLAATALRRDGESLEADAPDTVRFTRAIKETVAYEDRLAVIEALWKVVLADGHREAEEDALLRMVASLLGVSDLDSNLARKKAAGA